MMCLPRPIKNCVKFKFSFGSLTLSDDVPPAPTYIVCQAEPCHWNLNHDAFFNYVILNSSRDPQMETLASVRAALKEMYVLIP